MAENSAPNQRGRPFRPGQSGNPAGKPRGARHRATTMAERLMGDDAEAVIGAVLKAAKDGDMVACRIVLDRIAPQPKGRLIRIDLPPVRTAEDVAEAMRAVIAAAVGGQITPDEASSVAGLIEARRKAIETVNLEQRIAALEAR